MARSTDRARYAKYFVKTTAIVKPKAVFLLGVSATGTISGDEFSIFAPDMDTLQRMWLRVMAIPLDKKRTQRIAITRQTTITEVR